MQSRSVSVLVESRRSTRGGGALAWLRVVSAPIWARSAASTIVIDTAQKIPIAL
ncbi:hypothetical protein GALL_553880 [mine drainage metagenome]|uniref:Uncharacterized protein n=1 Tax=mine drainage metagenome TaxID=410659 RepID=A0A1J5PCW9_9ZZZZ